MGEDVGEWPVRLKNDVNDPALLPKKPVLHIMLHKPHDSQQVSNPEMGVLRSSPQSVQSESYAKRVGTLGEPRGG